MLTNPPRETVSSIDVVVVTQRWWLQGEAWPWLSLGEQENRERHFKRGEGHTSMNFWRWWRHGTWWLLVATTKVWPWVSQIGLVEWKRAGETEILKKWKEKENYWNKKVKLEEHMDSWHGLNDVSISEALDSMTGWYLSKCTPCNTVGIAWDLNSKHVPRGESFSFLIGPPPWQERERWVDDLHPLQKLQYLE